MAVEETSAILMPLTAATVATLSFSRSPLQVAAETIPGTAQRKPDKGAQHYAHSVNTHARDGTNGRSWIVTADPRPSTI